jgi:hypothetical protein
MENRVIEFGNKRSFVPDMLKRIKEAETRGAKFAPGREITERHLEEFERSGKISYHVGTSIPAVRQKTTALSESDRQRIRSEVNEKLEMYARQDERREQIREQVELNVKLRPFHGWVNEEKKENYLYL